MHFVHGAKFIVFAAREPAAAWVILWRAAVVEPQVLDVLGTGFNV